MGIKTYETLYESYVDPIMNYASGVWGFRHYDAPRVLQNRIMRFYLHGTGTEIRYQDPSVLPWSKMATATTGKDVYTAFSTLSHCVSRVWRWV